MTELAERQDAAAQFRSVMRGVAGTVAIVTASQEGAPVGMAATAFCSVSMDPPSLLVCVNRTASVLPAIRGTGRICLSILQSDNHDVCSFFGGKYSQEERFKFHAWEATDSGVPFLPEAQAVIECTVADELCHGTHCVFIADVVRVQCETRKDADPLIYVDGRYAKAVNIAA